MPVPELPNNIARLVRLRVLVLKDNGLTRLPDDFGALTALQRLEIHRNSLRELPASLSRLHRLRYLNLRDNDLAEVPFLGNMHELQDLWLSGNPRLRETHPRWGWNVAPLARAYFMEEYWNSHDPGRFGHSCSRIIVTVLCCAKYVGVELPPELWFDFRAF
eukprot:m.49374 g.49374  ORF g.49374 m.49374 type:complete len:161 (+) comp6478_c0_seq2:737-1219(+)